MSLVFIPVTEKQLKLFEHLGGNTTIQRVSHEEPIFTFKGLFASRYRTDKALVAILNNAYIGFSPQDLHKFTSFHTDTNRLINKGVLKDSFWIAICQ